MPYAAIQFVSFDQYKLLLLQSDADSLSPGRRLLAGSLAGATSVCCTYPLDLVRARMAVQPEHSTMRTCCALHSVASPRTHACVGGFGGKVEG